MSSPGVGSGNGKETLAQMRQNVRAGISGCPLPSTRVPWHTHTHTWEHEYTLHTQTLHTQTHKQPITDPMDLKNTHCIPHTPKQIGDLLDKALVPPLQLYPSAPTLLLVFRLRHLNICKMRSSRVTVDFMTSQI